MFCLVGDGMAEVLGRRYGSHKLPWSRQKSWIGSIAFVMAAYASCLTIGWIYIHQGFWGDTTFEEYSRQLLLLVMWCALVESITNMDGIDNITVFLGGLFASQVIWRTDPKASYC